MKHTVLFFAACLCLLLTEWYNQAYSVQGLSFPMARGASGARAANHLSPDRSSGHLTGSPELIPERIVRPSFVGQFDADYRRPALPGQRLAAARARNLLVVKAEVVSRPLEGRLGELIAGVQKFRHEGLRIITEDGTQLLVEKGPGYGAREGFEPDAGDTVVVDASTMDMGRWRVDREIPVKGGRTVEDYVTAGGRKYNVFSSNCQHAVKWNEKAELKSWEMSLQKLNPEEDPIKTLTLVLQYGPSFAATSPMTPPGIEASPPAIQPGNSSTIAVPHELVTGQRVENQALMPPKNGSTNTAVLAHIMYLFIVARLLVLVANLKLCS